MKGLVKVKGSWGMGGGLRGVASFSLSWLSVSMPVAIFRWLPEDSCALRCAELFAAASAAAALHACAGCVPLRLHGSWFAVCMRGQDVAC